MSLKTDIEMVKDELTSEEKFFEKAVVTEKFVKKYKNLMIGSVVAVVIFAAGNIAYNISTQNRIDSANAALSELQKNSKNSAVSARLKSLSPELSDAWLYAQAVATNDIATFQTLKKSKTILIGDLASYHLAQSSQDVEKLNAYASTDGAIYRDLAQVQAAIIFMNAKNITKAHEELSMIGLDSPLAQVAKTLMHYGVK